MKPIFIIFALFFVTTIHAQIAWERGYYINNSGNKISGLIENKGWDTSPDSFRFKSNENASAGTISIEEAQEFGFDGNLVFTRYTVEIDKSITRLDDLSPDRNPIYKTETLYLKKIVEGQLSLYLYSNFGAQQFFISLNKETPYELIKKDYYVNYGKRATNELYKQQLKKVMTCEAISDAKFNSIKYTKVSLVKWVQSYNSCVNSTSVVYNEFLTKKKGDAFLKLRARAGVRLSNSSIIPVSREVDLPSEIGPQIGIEGELVFTALRSKWSVLLGADYSTYNTEALDQEVGSFTFQDITLDYQVIDVGFHLRHSFFINEKNRLYLNAGVLLTLDAGSEQTQTIGRVLTDFGASGNFNFGGGYEYDKWNFDLRLTPSSSAGSNEVVELRDLRVGNIAFTVGYSFLN